VDGLGPGAWLAVDDAGAGFAGLRHVVELRPCVVKLDGGIVRGDDEDPARRSPVAGMVHDVRTTGSHLVAEGVETEAEAAALSGLGVEPAQGYLFGSPLEVAALPGVRRGRLARRTPGDARGPDAPRAMWRAVSPQVGRPCSGAPGTGPGAWEPEGRILCP
jgi:predicted signal transduction protein with EAL and GGDEF domain